MNNAYTRSKDDLIQSIAIQLFQASYGFGDDDNDCIKNKIDGNNSTMRYIAFLRYVYISKLDLYYSLK